MHNIANEYLTRRVSSSSIASRCDNLRAPEITPPSTAHCCLQTLRQLPSFHLIFCQLSLLPRESIRKSQLYRLALNLHLSSALPLLQMRLRPSSMLPSFLPQH